MNLPRSAAASGTPAFPDTLAGELADYLRQLPTERACEAGGMPGNERVVRVSDAGADASAAWATVAVGFEEAVGPTCGGSVRVAYRQLDFRMVIDRKTGRTTATPIDPDPPEEF